MPTSARKRIPSITFENCDIRYRNFAGKAGKYNAEGDRSFCLVLDPEVVDIDSMIAEGWNVRWTKPLDEEDVPIAYTAIRVSYDYVAPRVYIVDPKRGRKTPLGQDEIHILDSETIESVDCVINPSRWETHNGTGIKGYLSELYVVLANTELTAKYAEYEQDS